MRVLILGLGNVGRPLAGLLREAGHTVVGTTTTPSKREDLLSVADEVHVLRGNERDKVVAAAQGADAVVVTVAPNVLIKMPGLSTVNPVPVSLSNNPGAAISSKLKLSASNWSSIASIAVLTVTVNGSVPNPASLSVTVTEALNTPA